MTSVHQHVHATCFKENNTDLNELCMCLIVSSEEMMSRSRWPLSLRRRSVAARLLGSRFRIRPLEAWLSVCCECCVSPRKALCVRLIIRQEES